MPITEDPDEEATALSTLAGLAENLVGLSDDEFFEALDRLVPADWVRPDAIIEDRIGTHVILVAFYTLANQRWASVGRTTIPGSGVLLLSQTMAEENNSNEILGNYARSLKAVPI